MKNSQKLRKSLLWSKSFFKDLNNFELYYKQN